jgi:hypothetical protein
MSRQRLRAATIAVTFAFAAGLPTAAIAVPISPRVAVIAPHPPPVAVSAVHSPLSCSDFCSNAGYGTHDQSLSTAPQSTQLCSEVCSNGGYGTHGQSLPTGTAVVRHTQGRGQTLIADTVTAPAVHAVSNDSGFHWGDAGIGAGTVLTLTLLGLGGAFALAHRQRKVA